MTLDEAIKIETIHNDHNPDFTDAQRQEAHQLGIEALKRVRDNPFIARHFFRELLQGETK